MQSQSMAEPGFSFRRLVGVLAFAGFGISLLVHLSTFFGIHLQDTIPAVWLLHLGIFIVFIPMVFATQKLQHRKDFWRSFFSTMPKWTGILAKGLFVYAFLNFALFFVLSKGGVPERRDEKYVLHAHGQIIKELTREEYDWQQAYVLRGFSGHWMVFYLIPALYFFYSEKRASVR